jgi:ribosomal-protein-alanine N-acetyltransferase
MVAVYCDPEVMRFIPGGALADLGMVRATLKTHEETQETRGFSSWAVVERRTDRVLGDVGFGVFEPTGDIELGYTLARDFWGRGYATEAASACLAAGVAYLAAPRIVAVVDAENEASMRVAERIGMQRIDEIDAHGRPHVLFGYTR